MPSMAQDSSADHGTLMVDELIVNVRHVLLTESLMEVISRVPVQNSMTLPQRGFHSSTETASFHQFNQTVKETTTTSTDLIQLDHGAIPDVFVSTTTFTKPVRYKTFENKVYRTEERELRQELLISKLIKDFPDDAAVIKNPAEPGTGQPVFIFIDFSNIYMGAERFVVDFGHTHPGLSKPVLIMESLDFLLSRGRDVIGRYLTTSKHTRSDWEKQIQTARESRGYNVRILERVPNASGFREQAVDELLQKDMGDVHHDHRKHPGTVALATGDGNSAEFDAVGFPKYVRWYLEDGWNVELYCWNRSENRAWADIHAQYPKQFTTINLEGWASTLFERPDTIPDKRRQHTATRRRDRASTDGFGR
jgi:NYN domain